MRVWAGGGRGIVVNGGLPRGRDHVAGEFGHMTIDLNGPRCMCGARGCWEAYTSNLATLYRYFGRKLSKLSPKAAGNSEQNSFTILELIRRARHGDAKAKPALCSSGHFLSLGLPTIVTVLNPT